jgi:hypothetical protein
VADRFGVGHRGTTGPGCATQPPAKAPTGQGATSLLA